MKTRSCTAASPREEGFTLLEVLVTLAILGYAVVGFQASVGVSIDTALVTKVNRQLRQLVEYQMGQIAVGKLHPDEEDPFADGQSGTFNDVGGYPEEYESFTWEIRREEIPICGHDEEELRQAGFEEIRGEGFSRRQTDDVLAGTDENLEQPKGQFKSRVTLTVRWSGSTAEDDRDFSIVTYLPVNGEEEQEGGGIGEVLGGQPGETPGAAGQTGAAPQLGTVTTTGAGAGAKDGNPR